MESIWGNALAQQATHPLTRRQRRQRSEKLHPMTVHTRNLQERYPIGRSNEDRVSQGHEGHKLHRAAVQTNTGPTCPKALRHRHNRARAARRTRTGAGEAQSDVGMQRSEKSGGGTGGTLQGAQTTTRTRCPETPLWSIGGHRLDGHCHRRCCTWATNPWGHGGNDAGMNQVKGDMELCMQRGHDSRGKQTGTFLAGAGHSMKQPVSIRRPPRTTGQPQPHQGPFNAAIWATTGCSVAGPSANTTTAR